MFSTNTSHTASRRRLSKVGFVAASVEMRTERTMPLRLENLRHSFSLNSVPFEMMST